MPDSAFTAAIKLLARREHTRAELRQKLAARDFSDSDISGALQQAQEKNVQSDQRFCEAYLRQNLSRFGDFRLRGELGKRGADSATIEAAFNALQEDARTGAAAAQSEEERARLVLQKKYKNGLDAKDAVEKNSARRFLASRGFSMDSIAAAVGGVSDLSDLDCDDIEDSV